ncbi:MAG: hypothetical protein K2X77_05430 [Candidatus Obscuribacterales bacterium]|nr:hypothetical protein [Candidatus Obscuribacterales bacterium]
MSKPGGTGSPANDGERPADLARPADRTHEQVEKTSSKLQQNISDSDRKDHHDHEQKVKEIRANKVEPTTAGRVIGGTPEIGHKVGQTKVYLEKNQVSVIENSKSGETWHRTADGKIQIEGQDPSEKHSIVDGKLSVEKSGDRITAVKAELNFENGRHVTYRNGEPTEIKHPDGEVWKRDAKDKNTWHVTAHDTEHPGKLAHFDITNVQINNQNGDIKWHVISGEGKGHDRVIDGHGKYHDYDRGVSTIPGERSLQGKAAPKQQEHEGAKHEQAPQQKAEKHQQERHAADQKSPKAPAHDAAKAKPVETNVAFSAQTKTDAVILPKKEEPLVALHAPPALKLGDQHPAQKQDHKHETLSKLETPPKLETQPISESRAAVAKEYKVKLQRDLASKSSYDPTQDASFQRAAATIKQEQENARIRTQEPFQFDATGDTTGPKLSEKAPKFVDRGADDLMDVDGTTISDKKLAQKDYAKAISTDSDIPKPQPKAQTFQQAEAPSPIAPEKLVSQPAMPKPIAPEKLEVKAPSPLPAPHVERSNDGLVARLPKLEPINIKVEGPNQEQIMRMMEGARIRAMHNRANEAFQNIISNPSFLKNDFGSPQPRPGDLAKARPAEISPVALPPINTKPIDVSNKTFEPPKLMERPAPFAAAPPIIDIPSPKQQHAPAPVPMKETRPAASAGEHSRKASDAIQPAVMNKMNEQQVKRPVQLSGPPPLSDNSAAGPNQTNILKRVGAPPSSADEGKQSRAEAPQTGNDATHAKKALSPMQPGVMDHSLEQKAAKPSVPKVLSGKVDHAENVSAQKKLQAGMMSAKMDSSADQTQKAQYGVASDGTKVLTAKVEEKGTLSGYGAATGTSDYGSGPYKASDDYQSAYSKPLEGTLSDGRKIISANARSNDSTDQIVWTGWHKKMESDLGHQIQNVAKLPPGAQFHAEFHINRNGYAEGHIVSHNGLTSRQINTVNNLLRYQMRPPAGGGDHNLSWQFTASQIGQREYQITRDAREYNSYRDGAQQSHQFRYGNASNIQRNIGAARSYRPVQQPQQVMTYGSYRRYDQ